MKYLLIAAILLPGATSAQKSRVGFKAGYGLSRMAEWQSGGGRFYGAKVFGVDYRFRVRNLLLAVEALYDQRGAKTIINYTDKNGKPAGSTSSKIIMNYISTPVKVGLAIGKKAHAFGYLGVVPGILINEIGKSETVSGKLGVKSTTFDLSGIAEIGAAVPIKKLLFTVSGRYQHSLLPNFWGYSTYKESMPFYNQKISVLAGVSIPL